MNLKHTRILQSYFLGTFLHLPRTTVVEIHVLTTFSDFEESEPHNNKMGSESKIVFKF